MFWYYLISALFLRFHAIERLCMAVPLGMVSLGWLSTICATYRGQLSDGVAISVSIAHVVLALAIFPSPPSPFKPAITRGLRRSLSSTSLGGPGPSITSPGQVQMPVPFESLVSGNLRPSELATLALVLVPPLLLTLLLGEHMLDTNSDGDLLSGGGAVVHLPRDLAIIHSFVHGANSDQFSMFTLADPHMNSERLTFPYLPHIITAIFIRTGSSTREALLLTSVPVAFCFFLLLYSLAQRCTRGSCLASLLVCYAILTGGGNILFPRTEPSFWVFFAGDILAAEHGALLGYALFISSVLCIWHALDVSVSAPTASSDPGSAPAGRESPQLLPQHSPLKVRGNFDDADDKQTASTAFLVITPNRHQYLQFAGLIAALTPYIQLHCCFALIFIAPTAVLFDHIGRLAAAVRVGRSVSHAWSRLGAHVWEILCDAFAFGGPMALLAIPQLGALFSRVNTFGFVGRAPVWWEDIGEAGDSASVSSMLWFFLNSFGLVLILTIFAAVGVVVNFVVHFLGDQQPAVRATTIAPNQPYGGWAVASRSSTPFSTICLLFAAWVVLFFGLRNRFQPAAVSNAKIVYCWYIIAIIPVCLLVEKTMATIQKLLKGQQPESDGLQEQQEEEEEEEEADSHPLGFFIETLAWVLYVLVIVPGLSHLFHGQRTIFSVADQSLAAWTMQNTPPSAVFLVDQRYNHPVTSLAGRVAFLGDRQYLWERALPHHKETLLAHHIYGGHVNTTNLIAENGIDYVFAPKYTTRAYNSEIALSFLSTKLKVSKKKKISHMIFPMIFPHDF
eukprot:TRINITY_DN7084_c0_g1_i2.p1 TRINITY_DN7084_c0_g1~~TRINITY_DN7084_c0_g1_i2.p1  ORF type:complete len:789 (-),score=176.95 TRINITY_DN7084_c0_g1_i2:27-2393(-)